MKKDYWRFELVFWIGVFVTESGMLFTFLERTLLSNFSAAIYSTITLFGLMVAINAIIAVFIEMMKNDTF